MKNMVFLLVALLLVTACATTQTSPTFTPVPPTEPPPTEPPPTSTLTPEPTSTPVPPTPTIEPPTIIFKFLDGVEILNIDGFDNMRNWSTWNSGTGRIVDGMFELTGQNDWSSGLALSRKLKEGEGVILRFKTVNNAVFKSEFVFSTGAWQTDSFRQFGVYNGKNPKADLFQGKYGLGYNNLLGNLALKANTWYKLLMAVGEGGEFLAVVWDPADPSKLVSYNEDIGEKWDNKQWEFLVKATKGETVYIDDFSRISFNAIK
jgi:hypothetical protein